MKHCLILFFALAFLSCAQASAQTVNDTIATVANPDKVAEFKGGIQAWVRFLERNLNRDLPAVNGAPRGRYMVIASFVVDTDGSVKDIMIENDPGYGTAKEVRRIITITDKLWQPALLDNKPVRFKHRQSITFQISER